MSTPLIKEFNYNAPIEKVWHAITNEDKMRKWYFPQLQKFKPLVGFKFQFDDNDAKYQKEWVVKKVIEGKTLAHSWAYKGYQGNSEVIFDLFSEENKTRLKVTQTDLDSFPDYPHFKRDRFAWGWDNLLGQNLKHLLEDSVDS
ncbi:SRPBCC domain-containing protein [Pedobacter chinensis]|uniref:SRPBCC domain-containing protein n=1 Tax=Pedobacter chinensis TaxID=2282421 RepID=A0A369PZ10_9SPHI|nr:SRPBCC domain-containing protein [Pedobacter chinensis]RDC55939.1 SRPBCC domain-containing protein [Pedobacter chinensis]